MPNNTKVRRVTREERKVLAATLVGTSIEWYDFFIYAQAAALVFVPQFLSPLGESNPALAQLISFGTVAISFIFRPLGAVVIGRLGDRIGRRPMLVLTLILMGAGTSLIGVLPSYHSIGVAAPLLLILLRVVQGFSAGGEWGGAALMAVEHAPKGRRAYFGSFPQIGVPIGMLFATTIILLLQLVIGSEAFYNWGWRIPFLFSIALIFVGYSVRKTVNESPVYEELQERKQDSSAPLTVLFKKHKRDVIKATLIFCANNACGYLVLAFMISYLTGHLDHPLRPVLLLTCFVAFGWLIFTLFGGWLADKIGRIRTFQIGYAIMLIWGIPMWFFIDMGLWTYFFAVLIMVFSLGLTYGPQAALYSELFPARVRYSGASIAYGLGSVFGGAFAPMVAQGILEITGEGWYIGIYIIMITLISLGVASALKERQDCDLYS